MPNALTR